MTSYSTWSRDTFSKDMIFSINSFNFEGVRFKIIRVESGLKPQFNILKEQKPYTPDPNEIMCLLDGALGNWDLNRFLVETFNGFHDGIFAG